MMRLRIGETSIDVAADDGAPAGRYVFDDAYKPYLHPLHTPSGVLMSSFMPHDHKHHRGLMYALRTPELNFWEERSTLPGEKVGRQVNRGLSEITAAGDSVGFTQRLDWCELESADEIFQEKRTISCQLNPDGRSFAWSWHTALTAKVDLTLKMSQWSAPRADGKLVNYHGLGLRLPREFGGAQANLRISADGVPIEIAEALGQTPRSIEFRGAADGYWPVRFAGVRFAQGQSNALFIMKDPFAYIALGPSNDRPRTLKRGELIEEDYVITVFDADTPDA